MVLEAGKSKIKVVADSLSGVGPVPGTWTAVFLLCPHTVEGVREFCEVPFIRALIPLIRAQPSCPNHLPKAHLLLLSRWGLGFQHVNLGGGDTNIQSIT